MKRKMLFSSASSRLLSTSTTASGGAELMDAWVTRSIPSLCRRRGRRDHRRLLGRRLRRLGRQIQLPVAAGQLVQRAPADEQQHEHGRARGGEPDANRVAEERRLLAALE